MKFPILTFIGGLAFVAAILAILMLLSGCAGLPFMTITQPIGDPPAAWITVRHNAPPDPVAGQIDVNLVEGIPSDKIDFSVTDKGASIIIFREPTTTGKAPIE